MTTLPAATVPAQFRTLHGDPTTWTPADFDSYEHTLETTNPTYAAAAATGLYVTGRHAEGDHVVLDLATADELAQRTARRANPPDTQAGTCWFCDAENPAGYTLCGLCCHHADDNPRA